MTTPTLLIHGDRDPNATNANLPAFFERLGTTDRSQVVLLGVDHVAHLERHAEFADSLQSFEELGTDAVSQGVGSLESAP